MQKYFYIVLLLVITFICISFKQKENANAAAYGVATFYSDCFQGKKTANGERYDKNKLTAAHRSLPFGTKIKITNVNNKKSTVVRINDRGPWIKGRLLDVSRLAATKLGMVSAGKVSVKMEVIDGSTGVTLSESEVDDLITMTNSW